MFFLISQQALFVYFPNYFVFLRPTIICLQQQDDVHKEPLISLPGKQSSSWLNNSILN